VRSTNTAGARVVGEVPNADGQSVASVGSFKNLVEYLSVFVFQVPA
jgi:hypothetical protein